MESAEKGGGGARVEAACDFEMPGTLVYEYRPQVTSVVEFGQPADALFAGDGPPPPEGGRLDLFLEGPVEGPLLEGTLRGVDYLCFRADGRADLHIHGQITRADGKTVALEADGVAVREGRSSVYQLRENVKLTSHHPELAWVNPIQLWAYGVVDVASGAVHVRAFAV